MDEAKIIVTFTPEGIESIRTVADSEQEQTVAEEALDRVRPILDAVVAVLRKTSAGPRG